MITTEAGEVRYTLKEVAARTGKNLNTVRVYASRKGLGIFIGDMRFLSEADIDTIRRAKSGWPPGAGNRKTVKP